MQRAGNRREIPSTGEIWSSYPSRRRKKGAKTRAESNPHVTHNNRRRGSFLFFFLFKKKNISFSISDTDLSRSNYIFNKKLRNCFKKCKKIGCVGTNLPVQSHPSAAFDDWKREKRTIKAMIAITLILLLDDDEKPGDQHFSRHHKVRINGDNNILCH